MKKFYCLLVIFFSLNVYSQDPMIMKVNALGGINNVHIKLCATGVSGGGSWSFPYTFVKTNNATVTGSGVATLSPTEKIFFPEPGEYIFTLYPSANPHHLAFNFGNSQLTAGDRAKILEIQQWGDMSWSQNISRMFELCNNLTVTATDIPNFSAVTDMSYLFNGCSSISTVPNITLWQTANVTNITGMFSGCSQFNQNISAMNIGMVTSFAGLFYGCSSFNQPLTWSTAGITNMNSMFANATSFNQNISSWNTSNLTDMSNMFSGASSFQQNISNWDTSNVFNFSATFANATSFNQNLTNWNLISSVNMTGMFYNAGLSCENYTLTLKGWSEAAFTPSSITLGATGQTYGSQGQVYRNFLTTTKNWTITGDIYNSSCLLSTHEFVNKATNFIVYPNPSRTSFNLKTSLKGKAYLTDQVGNHVTTVDIKETQTTVDVSGLAAGVYYITLGQATAKVIIY